MFMLILIGSTPLMQGVVEEKMQRIAEVLLGSVRPFELMVGKLLGLVGVSVTLAAVYLSGAYWAAQHYGYAELISVDVMAWFLVYLVLGVLMYGSLFVTVGAACADLRETQAMLWPVMLLAMLPMFVWINVVREPTSTFSTVASFIPNATPMLMLARVAVPPGIRRLAASRRSARRAGCDASLRLRSRPRFPRGPVDARQSGHAA